MFTVHLQIHPWEHPSFLQQRPPAAKQSGIYIFRIDSREDRMEVKVCLGRMIYRDVRSPQRQVITQKLHDQSAVLVGLLAQRVQFRDGLVKSLT